jgi:rhomboid family GlyGly-CTERM serine protease
LKRLLLRWPWAPWWALCALAAAGALAMQTTDASTWTWQADRVWTQPWRNITAAWVHFSRLHLMANLAGTGLVAALGWAARCDARAAVAWALAWPATHGLLTLTGLHSYGGLSGVLHAAVVVAGWQVARSEQGPRRWTAVALLLGIALKVLMEAPWGPALRQVQGWDILVAPSAHAAGLLAGALCAMLCRVGTAPMLDPTLKS